MKTEFEDIIKKLSPTLRRISRRLNGHFSFFDEDDLFQEALEHLWVAYKEGRLEDKTDSYVLQGCYFHLKNYLRKTTDKANLTSLNKRIDDEDATLEESIASNDADTRNLLDYELLTEAARSSALSEREKTVLALSMEHMTTREIGRRLGISHVSVVKMKARIRDKCLYLKKEISGYQN